MELSKIKKNCKHNRTKIVQRGNVTLEICKDCKAHRVKNILLVGV